MRIGRQGICVGLITGFTLASIADTSWGQTCDVPTFSHWQVNGPSPRRADVCVVDLNGDGALDLVSVHDFSPLIASNLILRPGIGAFPDATTPDPFPVSNVVSLPVGDTPFGVDAGDLNGDGHIDLVVANAGYGGSSGGSNTDLTPDTISVLLGNGDLTFSEETQYTVGGSVVRDVRLADIDGDGDLDAVTAEISTDTVSVMTNDGTGVFTLSQTFDNSASGAAIEIGFADLNCDQSVDFVVVGHSSLIAYMNDGSGMFTSNGAIITSDVTNHSFEGIEAADFNRDGRIDLVTGSPAGNSAIVLLNNGDGTMTEVELLHGGFFGGISLSSDSDDVVVADFNGDYYLDVAVSAKKSIWIILGNGDGTFQPYVGPLRTDLNFNFEAFDDAFQLFVADMDGDHNANDIIVHQRGDLYEMVVMYNTCPRVPLDFNGDRAVDVHDMIAYLRAFDADDLSADTDASGDISQTDLTTWLAGLVAEAQNSCAPSP